MERLIGVTKDTDSFRFDADTYHKDYKIQCYLEKLFDSFYQAVWVVGKPIVTEESLIWGCHSIIILKYSGEFLHMSSSEWANFTRVLGEQQ